MSDWTPRDTLDIIGDPTTVGATPEQAATIAERGWVVVSAPRPLGFGWDAVNQAPAGFAWEHWSGPVYAGRFYAAGDPAAEDSLYGTAGAHWNGMDATQLRFVDAATLERDTRTLMDRLVARVGSIGMTYEDACLYYGDAFAFGQALKSELEYLEDPAP